MSRPTSGCDTALCNHDIGWDGSNIIQKATTEMVGRAHKEQHQHAHIDYQHILPYPVRELDPWLIPKPREPGNESHYNGAVLVDLFKPKADDVVRRRSLNRHKLICSIELIIALGLLSHQIHQRQNSCFYTAGNRGLWRYFK